MRELYVFKAFLRKRLQCAVGYWASPETPLRSVLPQATLGVEDSLTHCPPTSKLNLETLAINFDPQTIGFQGRAWGALLAWVFTGSGLFLGFVGGGGKVKAQYLSPS